MYTLSFLEEINKNKSNYKSVYSYLNRYDIWTLNKSLE